MRKQKRGAPANRKVPFNYGNALLAHLLEVNGHLRKVQKPIEMPLSLWQRVKRLFS